MRARSSGLELGSATSVASRAPVETPSRFRATVLAGRPYYFASWLALVGLILPAWEAQFSIADAKFTAGRLGIALLFIPALIILSQRAWRMLACDILAFLFAVWIPVAASYSDVNSLSSAGAESMEFAFSYIAGRALFFQPAALDSFIRVMKLLTIAVIFFAVVENISGRSIAHEVAGAIFGTSPLSTVFRGSTIRAASTFDHPILFGVFCALAGAILLFRETGTLRRALILSLCLGGCILSQSSAALMCFVLMLSACAYDSLLRAVSARWAIFWAVFGAGICASFLLAEHPIGWLISHLTLDPVSGYFRMLIWDAALDRISQKPWTGYALQPFDQNILDTTIDSVWLVVTLRFGIPAGLLLLLTNLAAIWPMRRTNRVRHANSFDARMSLAFTIVLLMFMFAGITVHFWNFMWMFWGLCIGIRASLRERALGSGTITGPVKEASTFGRF